MRAPEAARRMARSAPRPLPPRSPARPSEKAAARRSRCPGGVREPVQRSRLIGRFEESEAGAPAASGSRGRARRKGLRPRGRARPRRASGRRLRGSLLTGRAGQTRAQGGARRPMLRTCPPQLRLHPSDEGRGDGCTGSARTPARRGLPRGRPGRRRAGARCRDAVQVPIADGTGRPGRGRALPLDGASGEAGIAARGGGRGASTQKSRWCARFCIRSAYRRSTTWGNPRPAA